MTAVISLWNRVSVMNNLIALLVADRELSIRQLSKSIALRPPRRPSTLHCGVRGARCAGNRAHRCVSRVTAGGRDAGPSLDPA